jgi:hypothetical protein
MLMSRRAATTSIPVVALIAVLILAATDSATAQDHRFSADKKGQIDAA